MLNVVLSSHRLPRPGWVAFGLLLLLCALARDANAAAVSAMSTSVGLAAALLSLLALQDGSPAMAALTLAAVVLVMLAMAAAGRVGVSGPRAAWSARRAKGPVVRASAQGRFDARLLEMAREQFLRLQSAWDRADIESLRELTTPAMLDELVAQLPARGPGPNRTEVLSLEVYLLSHEQVGGLELAGVEFSGMVRESPERGTAPFREVWMLARAAADGGGWRLARQQALL